MMHAIFTSFTKAFFMVSMTILIHMPSSLSAGCEFGCPTLCPLTDNFSGITSNDSNYTMQLQWDNYPEIPEVIECCSPGETGAQYWAGHFNFHVWPGYQDTDKYRSRWWHQDEETCECDYIEYGDWHEISDYVNLSWSWVGSSLDQTTPGTYTLRATLSNNNPASCASVSKDPDVTLDAYIEVVERDVSSDYPEPEIIYGTSQSNSPYIEATSPPSSCATVHFYLRDPSDPQINSYYIRSGGFDVWNHWKLIDGPSYTGCNGGRTWSQSTSTTVGVTESWECNIFDLLKQTVGFTLQTTVTVGQTFPCSGTSCTIGQQAIYQRYVTAVGNVWEAVYVWGFLDWEEETVYNGNYYTNNFAQSCSQAANISDFTPPPASI